MSIQSWPSPNNSVHPIEADNYPRQIDDVKWPGVALLKFVTAGYLLFYLVISPVLDLGGVLKMSFVQTSWLFISISRVGIIYCVPNANNVPNMGYGKTPIKYFLIKIAY